MTSKEMQQKVKSKKIVKKTFFEVNAPLTSTRIQLYAGEKEELINKTVKIDLTKNLRGKSLELKLRVKLEDGELVGEPENVVLADSYVRRAVRKGTDYCEDSFESECKDYFVRTKPIMVTRKKVSRAVLRAIRENTKSFLEGYMKVHTAKEIFNDIITNKIQKQLSLKLKKVYPLSFCEIRVFELVRPKAQTGNDSDN